MRTIVQLLDQQCVSAVMNLKDGGVIHPLSESDKIYVADRIAGRVNSWRLKIPMICAGLRGESFFDFDAINPNLEDNGYRPWPSPAISAGKTDYGIAQVNDNGTYLGRVAVDISLDYMCGQIIENMAEIVGMQKLPIEVAYEAYNQGIDGAVKLYKAGGLALCTYGRVWAERVEEFADVV